jgi:hypothetical protein
MLTGRSISKFSPVRRYNPCMTIDQLLANIDAELAQLIKARDTLPTARVKSPTAAKPKRRKLSKAARERIAAAQLKRWAKQRAAAK